jgi:TM2 domain-containing membrane protein YozV
MYRILGKDGLQYGPATAEQLRTWIAENRVNAQTQVFADGASEWKPLGSFPEFAASLKGTETFGAAPPVLTAPPGTINPRASNKLPAGVCGILLGAFGVHKFILGYAGSGLIMLLVTVLTCGLAYPVMHVIGLVEGIMYLAKSDDEFVRLYVDGRKEWF